MMMNFLNPLNGITGSNGSRGAAGAQQSRGLLEKVCDPLGILPRGLNPANGPKMLLKSALAPVIGTINLIKG